VEKLFKESIQKRIDMVNDPKELLESSEQISLDNYDRVINSYFDKLGFSLPNKLIMPLSFAAMANTFAQEIKVKQDHLVVKFDPRKTGLISEKVSNVL